MTPAQQIAHRILFDQNPVNPTATSFAPTRAPFSQPRFMPQQPAQLPQAVPMQARLPFPPPNPSAATAGQPGSPLPLAPPVGQFSGSSGPQWTDPQWQNFWDRSTPTY